MTDSRLLCIGNITIDEAFLPDGTTRADCLGGDALYAALAAKLFEPAVRMLAPLGGDLDRRVIEEIESAGFAAERLPRRDAPTVRNGVRYFSDGRREWDLRVSEAVFGELSIWPADLDEDAFSCPAVMISAMELEAQLATADALRASEARTLYLDLQEDYIEGNEERLRGMIAKSAVFLPSEEEVRRLLGHDDFDRAVRELSSWGPHTVVVKLAERGSLVYDRKTGDTVHVPAAVVRAVDSTGAGDAYCGGFAAVHARTGDPVAAARAGSVAAAVAVSGFGVEALLRADPRLVAERAEALRA